MNTIIASLLLQDGVTSGAIYAILALALILVFSVTRILFLPQGELVSLSALSLAAFQAGKMPGTIWLLAVSAAFVALMDLWRYVRRPKSIKHLKNVIIYFVVTIAAIALSQIDPARMSFGVRVGMTFLIVAPLAPIMYRVAFEPIANASVLTLLIAAVALHFVVSGIGLYIFGPEGVRTPPIVQSNLNLFDVPILGQGLFVIVITLVLSGALLLLFRYSIYGKALLATAYNRVGSQLVGIMPENAGIIAFTLTGIIGAISGILVSSLTTVYYDTGFMIGLKGFVAAIVGGLISYPLAFVGALLVGILESYSAFWASQFKDVIVFALVIPILLWRNMASIRFMDADDE